MTAEHQEMIRVFSEVKLLTSLSLSLSLSLSYLQGGVDDEVTLSAYVTIALLEIPLAVTVGTLAEA